MPTENDTTEDLDGDSDLKKRRKLLSSINFTLFRQNGSIDTLLVIHRDFMLFSHNIEFLKT